MGWTKAVKERIFKAGKILTFKMKGCRRNNNTYAIGRRTIRNALIGRIKEQSLIHLIGWYDEADNNLNDNNKTIDKFQSSY